MAKQDTRIDDYIAKSPKFAQLILTHLRKVVHKACPEIEETIKWGFPHFDYKGMMCSMAAFKNHCTFGFWKGVLINDPKRLLTPIGKTGMAHFAKITMLDDLPDDAILKEYIKEAIKLNETGAKVPSKPKATAKKALEIPGYLVTALKQNKAASDTFQNFSYTNKKEYVEWLTTAKTEATQEKRLATTIEWLAEGKIRNWKYVRK